jgi:hypothetical protein
LSAQGNAMPGLGFGGGRCAALVWLQSSEESLVRVDAVCGNFDFQLVRVNLAGLRAEGVIRRHLDKALRRCSRSSGRFLWAWRQSISQHSKRLWRDTRTEGSLFAILAFPLEDRAILILESERLSMWRKLFDAMSAANYSIRAA